MGDQVRLRIKASARSAGSAHEQQPAPARGLDSAGRSALWPEEEAARSHGQPLDPATRAAMEARFGHDFGQVRIHTDAPAAVSARALAADAFTAGTHIYFAPGQYRPGTRRGEELLAHELAHVVQQPRAVDDGALDDRAAVALPAGPRAAVSRPGDALETEAAQAAGRVSAGQPAGPALSRATPAAANVIARQASGAAPPQAADVDVQLDPAQITNNLANSILQNLQSDPADRAGRVRRQLANLAPEARDRVINRLRDRMTQARWQQLAGILAQEPPAGAETVAQPRPEAAAPRLPGPARPAGAPSAGEQLLAALAGILAPTPAPAAGPEAGAPAQVEAQAAAPETAGQAAAQAGAAEAAGQAEGGEEAPPAVPKLAAGPAQPAAAAGAAAAGGPEPAAVEAGGPAMGESAPAGGEIGPETPAAAGQAEAQAAAEAAAAPVPEQVEAPPSAAEAEQAGTPAAAAAPMAETPVTAAGETPAGAAAGPAPAGEVEAGPPGGAAPGETEEAPAPAGEPPEPAITEPPSPPSPEAAAAMPEPGEAAASPAEMPDVSAAGEAPAGQAAGAAGPAGTAAETEPAAAAAASGAEEVEAAAGPAAPGPVAAEMPAPAGPEPAAVEAPAVASAAPVAEPAMAALPPAVTPAEPAAGPPAPGEALPEPAVAVPSGPQPGEIPGPETEAPPPGPEPAMPAAAAPAGGPAGSCAKGPGAEEKPEGEEGAEGGECAAGGEGGGAAGERPQPPAPDVSNSDPVGAMGSLAGLPPAQLRASLGGVTAAAQRDVSAKQQTLAANPPQIQRPTGAPPGAEPGGPVMPPPSAAAAPPRVERAPAGAAVAVAAPAPLPAPPPAPKVPVPAVTGAADGKVSEADVKKMQEAVHSLPTTDPALHVTAGAAPPLVLEGDSDPALIKDQQAKLASGLQDAKAQGAKDLAQPMGEDKLYPNAPPETLTANPEAGGEGEGPGVLGTLAACATGGGKGLKAAQAKAQGAAAAPGAVGGAGPAAAGGQGGGPVDDETASILGQEKKGDEIKAALSNAQAGMTRGQQDQATKEAAANSALETGMDEAVRKNGTEQSEERKKARAAVLGQRKDWNDEQTKLVDGAVTEADGHAGKGAADVEKARTEGQKQANDHIEDGNKKIAGAREKAETTAAAERKKADENADGFWGWLGDKVKSFFEGIKNAIMTAFETARKAVAEAAEAAKKLATGAIEAARQKIVEGIRWVGDKVVAIGDRVLKDFPGLRDRFRGAIQTVVDDAVKAVNKLAEGLKKAAQFLIDTYAGALKGALGLLECAYLAEVEFVQGVVQGAIDLGRTLATMAGEFVEVIKDVAADPLGWLGKLGRAAMSGVRNCLWGAFKRNIKKWFNEKLEEVLGLGLAIWNLIKNGCLSLKKVADMAWKGLIAALPGIVIQLIIEKLIAAIIPAAGAIMTIIEGLKAAWGTAKRVLKAIQKFLAFLKAVKAGPNAAGQFADLLSSAAIVVIDFIANWLIQRLKKPAGAVASAIKGMATKILGVIGKGLKVVGGLLKRGVKAGVTAIKKGLKYAAQGVKRGVAIAARGLAKGARYAGRKLAAAGRAIAGSKAGRSFAGSRAGRVLIAGVKKVGQVATAVAKKVAGVGRKIVASVKQRVRRAKKAFKDWRERRKANREARRAERRARAESETKAALARMLARKGTPGLLFRARLLWLRLRWGWKELRLKDTGQDEFAVEASMSPGRILVPKVVHNMELDEQPISVKLVGGGTARILKGRDVDVDPEIRKTFDRVRAMRLASFGQPKGLKKAWSELELAARAHYLAKIAPSEGIEPGTILHEPELRTPWTTGRVYRGRAEGSVYPESLGMRMTPGGRKVQTFSLLEATMQADTRIRTSYSTNLDPERKLRQLRGFLDGIKLRIAEMEASGKVAKKLQIHLHYVSDLPMASGTQSDFEMRLKEADLPNVTVYWHRL